MNTTILHTEYATVHKETSYAPILSRVCTANLWGKNHINDRLPHIINVFKENGFICGEGIAIAIQEGDPEVVQELAIKLGFSPEQVRGYPSPTGTPFHIGVLTDLKVRREYFDILPHDPTDPLEFGQRALLLLELEDAHKPVIFAATHLTVSPSMQSRQARKIIREIKKFTLDGVNIPESEKKKPYQYRISNFRHIRKIILAGDFNASPDTPIYRKVFKNTGFKDYTHSLSKFEISWPSDIHLVINTHRGNFKEDPPYDVKGQARWMDYIFCAGCGFKNTWVMGDKKIKDIEYKGEVVPLYPSDHKFVGVTLEV